MALPLVSAHGTMPNMERFLLTSCKVAAYTLACLIIGWVLLTAFIGTGIIEISGNLALLFAMSAAVLASPLLGAWAVWRTVRWLNRRDDPRLVKPPPDAP
jgi:hypothetical protein